MPTASPPAATKETADDGRIDIERALAERFAAGDHLAVEAVFDQCGARIRNYAWLMIGDRETAEEIAQETFLAAYQSRASLRSPDSMGSWLIGIARNLALKELRRRRRRPEYLLGESGLSLLEESPDESDGADSLLAQRRLRGTLRGALDGLRESEREMIAMRYLAQMPLKQIAEALGVPVGSVGTTIKRGLEKLRQSFADQGMALEDFL